MRTSCHQPHGLSHRAGVFWMGIQMLRQYERLSQRDNDNNDLKQTLIRIQNAILSNCPWIVENTRMAKERGRSQNAVHVAVVGIAPENTKQ